MNNCCICWFSRIFLLGILIFKGLTARRLYKSFGVKGLTNKNNAQHKMINEKHSLNASAPVADAL
jgi:hypothetical protein